MEYKINEIFYSIQGEGHWTGIPMVFIRLAGCNYNCEFCDTDYTEKINLQISTILTRVRGYPIRNICITGGEPFLQDLLPLVSELHKLGFFIHIETNGSYIDKIKELAHFGPWVTCSPKEEIDPDDWCYIDELKWLTGDGKELWKSVVEKNLWHLCAWNFIQPVWGKINYENAIKIVKENPGFRLGVQLHKLLEFK